MRRDWWSVLLELLAILTLMVMVVRTVRGDTATDTGANTTTSGTVGTVTSEFVVTREQNANSRANFQRLFQNDTDITPDPTCANICTSTKECWVDSDESAADSFDRCIGATTIESVIRSSGDVVQKDVWKVPVDLTPDGTNGVTVNASGLLSATGTGKVVASYLADGGTTALTCGSGKQGQLQVLDDGTLQYCDGAGTSAMHKLGPVPLAITGSNGLLALEWLIGGTPVAIDIFPQATDKPDEGNAAVAGTLAWAVAQFVGQTPPSPVIHLAKGIYYQSTTITLANVKGGEITGDGPGNTIIYWANTTVRDPVFIFKSVNLLTLGGMTIRGTSSTSDCTLGCQIWDGVVVMTNPDPAVTTAAQHPIFRDFWVDGATTGINDAGVLFASPTSDRCTGDKAPWWICAADNRFTSAVGMCCTSIDGTGCNASETCDADNGVGGASAPCNATRTKCVLGANLNNDFAEFNRTYVTNGIRVVDCTANGVPAACCTGDHAGATCGAVGWKVDDYSGQSVQHTFYDCHFAHLRYGVYANSFTWSGGFGGGSSGADFFVNDPQRPIVIRGSDHEGSQRFWETAGPNASRMPIEIDGSRWANASVIAATACTAANNPQECCTGNLTGPTCGIVGLTKSGGPLLVQNLKLDGGGKATSFKVDSSGSPLTYTARNNQIQTTVAAADIFAVARPTSERWTLQGNGRRDGSTGVETAIPDQQTMPAFVDATDPSKKLALTISGFTTATTRTDTHPNRDLTLAGTSGTLTSGAVAAFDASGNLVTNAAPTLNGSVTLAGSDGSRSITATDNATEPTAPAAGSTLLYPLGGEWYKKDNGDGTNERLLLNNANVTGDISCAAPSGGTSSCTIGADKVTATQVQFNWAVSGSEGGPATSAVTLTDGDHGDFSCTSGTCTLDAGVGGGNAFGTITTSSGTSPVADSTSDTLTLTGTAPITVTGTAATDTIVIAASDATSGAKGIIQLAGDLAGTAASPQIAAGAVDINTDTTGNYVASLNCSGALTGCPSAGHASSGTLDVNALQSLAQLGDLCAGNESTRRNTGDTANACFIAAVGNAAGEALTVADGGVQLSTVAAPADTVGNYVQSMSISAPLVCTGCAANQGTTPQLSLTGTSAQWDGVNSDGDFMVQGRAETVSGIKSTSTRRNDVITAAGAIAAGGTIPATTTYVTFTVSANPTTFTGVPTVATSGVAAGTPLTLVNVSATACAIFQDAAVTGTATALSLRGSTRILCPGDGGLRLVFDGTNWIEQASGSIRLQEGTSVDKGVVDRINFESVGFDLTTSSTTGITTVALGDQVSILGQSIEKAEANDGKFVFNDQANLWSTGAQTVKGPAYLSVQKSDATNIINCGNLDASRCRLGADPSNALDAATKQYVDGRYELRLFGQHSQFTMSGSGANGYYFNSALEIQGGTTFAEMTVQTPITTACTVRALKVLLGRNNTFPATSTLTTYLRRNAANVFSCAVNGTETWTQVGAGTNYYYICNDTTSTAAAFAVNDRVSFATLCTGAGCSDNTTLFVVSTEAECEAP